MFSNPTLGRILLANRLLTWRPPSLPSSDMFGETCLSLSKITYETWLCLNALSAATSQRTDLEQWTLVQPNSSWLPWLLTIVNEPLHFLENFSEQLIHYCLNDNCSVYIKKSGKVVTNEYQQNDWYYLLLHKTALLDRTMHVSITKIRKKVSFCWINTHVGIYICSPPLDFSTLEKELPVAIHVMQSSPNELSTPVAVKEIY